MLQQCRPCSLIGMILGIARTRNVRSTWSPTSSMSSGWRSFSNIRHVETLRSRLQGLLSYWRRSTKDPRVEEVNKSLRP